MSVIKQYQYKNVSKTGPVTYSGELALDLVDGTSYAISTPVNTAENYTSNSEVVVVSNSLDNKAGKIKFSLAFDINKELVGIGTKKILHIPGLVNIYSESGYIKFVFEFTWSNMGVVYSYSSEQLLDGWNTISLTGDGIKIVLSINNTEFTLVDESVFTVVRKASGFAQYKYMYSNFTNVGKANTWEWQVGLDIPGALLTNCRIVQDRDNYDAQRIPKLEIYNEKCQVEVPGIVYPSAGIPVELNSSAIFRFTFDGSNYIEAKSVDGGKTFSTIQTTPVDASFTLNEGTTYWQCWGGRKYDNRSSCVFKDGKIILSYTHIKINDVVLIDGSTYDFTKDDGISIYDDYTYPEGVYPELTLGVLKTYQTWLYLKNINALYIEE